MFAPITDHGKRTTFGGSAGGGGTRGTAKGLAGRLASPDLLGPRQTWGALICTWSCGIIAGIAPIIEAEGEVEVARCLNEIWPVPRHRPTLLFYDRGCKRRRFLRNHPDPTWDATINLIDRFHFRHHQETDCWEFCSPERIDDPLLWRNNGVDDPTFLWNSSRAEATNSSLQGLGNCVSKMGDTLNRFTLMTNMFAKNELHLRKGLRKEMPRFRP